MSYIDQLTTQSLREIQVEDTTVKKTRARRDAVRDVAETFTGSRGTYASGSITYGTAIRPVNDRDKGVDGDAGLILDRRTWNTLGPDSDAGQGPCDVVAQVQDHIRPELKKTWPNATVGKTDKRAIRIRLGEPLDDGSDPPVELIVAVERAGAPGLWIPNLNDNTWDPAHPQKHRTLINVNPTRSLRVRRAKIVRIAKWWNKRHSNSAFSSFHLQALALETLTGDEHNLTLVSSLETYFSGAADSLEAGMTQDPADVSGILKLQNGVVKATAIKRLRAAADAVATARTTPNDQTAVYDALKPIFGESVIDAAYDAVEAAALTEGNHNLGVADSRIQVASTRWEGQQPVTRKTPPAWRRS
jgi:hypothetical protein